MKICIRTACVLVAAIVTSCGGGGSVAPGISAASNSSETAAGGTLSIGVALVAASSRARAPAFVSPATLHAALFIDGAVAMAGTSTCTTTGTTGGTGTTACTIPWNSPNLSVPATHTFAVEIDTGAAGTPANTVLAEGRASYALVAGSNNALGTLALNGAVADVTYSVSSCTTGACAGVIQLAAAAGNVIAYTGTTTVPANGNNPTTGTIYDNGNVTFASSNTAAGTGGLITGSGQTSGSNTYSTYATNTLTVSGVDTNGAYTYVATCNAAATGTFGIISTLVGSPSLDVTAAELAGLRPVVNYPTGLTVLTTAPNFTCTSGSVSDASGSLTVN